MPAEDPKFPGIQRRPRKNGTTTLYWIPLAVAVKAGFGPKSVRLNYPDGSDALSEHCHMYQAKMDKWLAALKQGRSDDPYRVIFDGTLGCMIDIYLSHPDSPYQELSETSQGPRKSRCGQLKRILGDRRVRDINGIDFRRWHREFKKPAKEGEQERVYGAHDLMTMLRTVIGFGVELGLPHAKRLRDILAVIRFPDGEPRQQVMTYEQTCAFIDKALEFAYPEMAAVQAIEYETTLRPIDVIGRWSSRTGKWEPGLTRDMIEAGILALTPRKTRKTSKKPVAHDFNRDHPLTSAALARLPEWPDEEALIIDSKTGKPFKYHDFRVRWRLLARAAGIPDDVWNRDARAGGVTEGRDAGASLDDLAHVAGHTRPTTTGRYDRTSLEKSRRVAKLRVTWRNNSGTE